MKYRRLGATGLEVSAITLGCMSWGDPARGGHPWVLSEDDARPIVRAALEAGVTASTPPTSTPVAAARRSPAGC